MASILKHLRSSTADKRPTASGLADGQIAINTASGSPGIFFKDSNSNVVKVGPVHVGAAAPNASPVGSAGNSLGELWVDNSLTTPGLNYYTGSAFVNLTPSGTTSTVGLVELATNAETQTGSDAVRAVTPAGLQSKVSDSISTTSSITIASATAVKTAYDLANAALPKSGGTVTGEILISPSGSLVFEGSSDDSFETTLAVVNPTADRTITLPNITGTVVTTGDTGTVTSTMIADGTIVNADINASAAIAPSKLGSGALPNDVTVSSTNIVDGTIVNADVNASAAIAGTKISPDFGGQTVQTTDVFSHALGTAGAPTITFTGDTNTGIYSPGADQLALSTNGTGRLFVDASGQVGVGAAAAVGADFEVRNAGATSRVRINSGTALATDGSSALDFVSASSGSGVVGTARIAGSAPAGGQSVLAFSTSATANSPVERVRITNDGYLRMATGSGGIQFGGDTAAANALDDYEEGVWTPAWSFATSGSVTYSTQYGEYVKIGNTVIARGALSVNSISSPTGTATITGLPFLSGNRSSNYGSGSIGIARSFASAGLTLRVYNTYNTSAIQVAKNDTNAGTVQLQGSDFTATSIFFFTIAYAV